MDLPHDPTCRFCASNGHLDIIRKSLSGHTCFVQVLVQRGSQWELADGAFFVLPTGHYKPDEDMPFDFMHEVNWHIRESGLAFDNGGFNYTEDGGAKILSHAHYWLMQAQPDDQPMGLFTLREQVRATLPPGHKALALG